VDDQILVASDVISKVDALLDFAVGLQKLVESRLMDIVFVVLQKSSELCLLILHNFEEYFSHFLVEVNALTDLSLHLVRQVNVDFVNVSQL
jgi:hypothetical protein